MQVDLRILRYDPERDAKPHWESYLVDSEPMDRVLDLLHRVKYEQDGTLPFRRSCAHKVCGRTRCSSMGGTGSPARSGGAARKRRITVAPLPGCRWSRTWSSTWRVLRQVPQRHAVPRDRWRGPGARAASDRRAARALRRHKVHPVRRVHQLVPVVLGPARLCRAGCVVNAHRFIFDSRDDAAESARDPRRQGRRVALPDDLQLHRRLPSRDQHHRAILGSRRRSWSVGPERRLLG